MKQSKKQAANLLSGLYNTGNVLDRDNYVSLLGGLAENKSDVKVGGYQDTCDQSSGSYDVVMPSIIDVLDTLDSTDKPA